MTEHSLRFSVRAEDGLTCDIWKLWTSTGTGKHDVYMTSRPLGHALKLSLHAEEWHVGFDASKRDKLFTPDTLPKTRFLGKWQRPESNQKPIVLATRVYFPWSSPSASEREAPADTIWLACAPESLAVEVAVFLVRVEAPVDEWPGQKKLGTSLVGNLPLEGGGRICVVHRNAPLPQVPSATGNPNYFRGKSKENVATANRVVAWGEEPDGSISFLEAKLEVKRGSAA